MGASKTNSLSFPPFQWKLYFGLLPATLPLYELSEPLPRLWA